MSNYDYKVLKIKEILNEDLSLAWEQICKKVGNTGKDFHTVSMNPRKNAKERWFNASSDQNRVLIQKAKDPSKNSNVKMHYWIRQSEFEILAKLYNEYVSDVSCNIRYTDSHVSSYIITLIAELL